MLKLEREKKNPFIWIHTHRFWYDYMQETEHF